MTLPIPLIDHVIINARDALDDCAALWTRLGFQLTPRGHHTLGSSNNLAILGNDYIELLGVMPGTTQRTDVLDYPPGLTGIAMKTTGSGPLFAALTAAGAPVHPPQSFSRPVDMGDGTTGDAAFRTVRLEPGSVPGGRMFFCDHLTPQFVWHDPWRRHPNGAIGIAAILIATAHAAPLASLFATVFGPGAVRSEQGTTTLPTGLASIEAAAPEALARRIGAVPPAETMAGLVIRTASLANAAAALQAGKIPVRATPNQLIVAAADAGGVTLIFTE